jgi:hypothetical protein
MNEERVDVDVVEVHTEGFEDYTGKSVDVFRDGAHIRERPGMYRDCITSFMN